MVNKLTLPAKQNDVVNKVNELVDNKQDALVSGTNIKTINNQSILGSGNIDIQGGGTDISGNKVNGAPLSNTSSHFFGISTSAATDVEKVVSIPSITELTAGVAIIVLPTKTSTVANATLKLNNFDAYPIRYQNSAITTSTDSFTWTANTPSVFVFDGDYWRFVCQGYRQVYATMSVSEGTTGTATTARSMRADHLKSIILGTTLTGLSTSTNSAVVATDSITVGIGKLQAQVNSKQAEITSSNKLSASLVSDLATVATSGSYNDLSDKPTIPSAVTEATVSGWGFTKNTGTVTSVNNVSPVNGNVTLSIPAAQVNSDWNATSGVAQILNKPTIPTVNNAMLTIQKNGSNVATFTANASNNVTANISVPNTVSSVSSSSTNADAVGAKLFYDTCGDIETLINAL